MNKNDSIVTAIAAGLLLTGAPIFAKAAEGEKAPAKAEKASCKAAAACKGKAGCSGKTAKSGEKIAEAQKGEKKPAAAKK